jgi:DMSO/TMAO reductase YedYZ molybdopterin-dependent catalytic subunit
MEILKLNLVRPDADAPTENEARFQVALLTGLIGLATSFIARFTIDAPLIPELLAQAFFAILPINFIALVVGFLGPFAKHLAFLGFVVLYLIGIIAAPYYYLSLINIMTRPSRQAIYSHLIFLMTIWLLSVSLLIPLLGGGLFGRNLRQGAWFTSLSMLLVYAIYTLTMALVIRRYGEKPEVAKLNNRRLNRRQFVRGLSLALVAIGVYDIGKSLVGSWFQRNAGRVTGGDGVFPNIDGLALEVTPTDDFYVVSKNPFDPDVAVKNWRMEIGGQVENPYSINYEELKSFTAIEQYATLECIDNPVGGNLIGNALWRGIRLKDVLERASLKAGVVDVVFHARDDYTDSIPIERAMNDATLLVYEMNRQPLTQEHGFPLRLLVPGIFGMKNVKWITKIEAVDFDYKGYWQRRGWDDRAEYKTISRIDVPDSTVIDQTIIAGIAFAGDRGISKVEVSTDGGKNWEAAQIKPAQSQYTWVLWQKDWSPEQAGTFLIKVRATDGRGNIQTSQITSPDPSGATGLHQMTIDHR